jgi:hypothetical protein
MRDILHIREAGAKIIKLEDLKLKDNYCRAVADYREMITLLHSIQNSIGKYIPNDSSQEVFFKPADMDELRSLFRKLITHLKDAEELLGVTWGSLNSIMMKHHLNKLSILSEEEKLKVRDIQESRMAVEQKLELLIKLLENTKKKNYFAKEVVDKHVTPIKKMADDVMNIGNLLEKDKSLFLNILELNGHIEAEIDNWFRCIWDHATHPKDDIEQYSGPCLDKESIRINQKWLRWIYGSIHDITVSIWYLLKLLDYEVKNDGLIKSNIKDMMKNYVLLLDLDTQLPKEQIEIYESALIGFPYGRTEEEAERLSKEFFESIIGK